MAPGRVSGTRPDVQQAASEGLLRDQLAGVLGQIHEDPGGLRAEGHQGARTTAELPSAEVEVERENRMCFEGVGQEAGGPGRCGSDSMGRFEFSVPRRCT